MAERKTPRYKKAPEEAAARLTELVPRNERQSLYLEALKRSPQTIVYGYSGTGKTYMAAVYAANLYLQRKINKIILTRPNVSVGKDLGALPGTLNEKFQPWAAPVLDVLAEVLSKNKLENDIKNGNVEMAPLSTMRGRSFSNAFIIMDEAQNTTIPEMKMFLTRIGEDCHVVINGDIKQSDIRESSGLSKIIHIAKKNQMDIPVIEFKVDDIVRSDICKQWIIGFEGEGL